MGDGKKESPYTRKDVIRLIEEKGGSTEGLNFSGKVFEESIDLSGLNLEGINFRNAIFQTKFVGRRLVGVKFDGSNLNRSDFRGTNLQYAQFGIKNESKTSLQGADLRGTILLNVNFQKADLTCAIFGMTEETSYGPATFENTDLRQALLFRTNFIECFLYGCKLEGAFIRGADIYDSHLEEVEWGNYKIGEEVSRDFYSSSDIYRRLKNWYTDAGMYDAAAQFYYRHKEINRKAKKWLSTKTFRHRLAVQLIWAYFGYGEGWKRILFWVAGLWLLFSLLFYCFGKLDPESFWDCLYFSGVSLTAVGYGAWVKDAVGIAKWLGVFETLIGNLMLASLLVTFVRKMTR